MTPPEVLVSWLVRLDVRGPASKDLRELLDSWLNARRRERELGDALAQKARAAQQLKDDYSEALADYDALIADEQETPEPDVLAQLQKRMRAAEHQQKSAQSRLNGFKRILTQRAAAVATFAAAHGVELDVERVPELARKCKRVLDLSRELDGAWDEFGEECTMLDYLQQARQGGGQVHMGVMPPNRKSPGELIKDLMRHVNDNLPLVYLPGHLHEVAQAEGMAVVDTIDRRIPVNDLRDTMQMVPVQDAPSGPQWVEPGANGLVPVEDDGTADIETVVVPQRPRRSKVKQEDE